MSMGPGPLALTERWEVRAGPHRHAGSTHEGILASWILAAGLAGLWGTTLFGPAAFKVLAVAILSAAGTELLVAFARGGSVVGGLWHACLTGLLLGLTLPATVGWHIPAMGAAVAIIFGKVVFGGLGHYYWHPALVGRVVMQLVFINSLSLGSANGTWPVLAPGHLWFGSVSSPREVDMPAYGGWRTLSDHSPDEAVSMERPVQALRRFAEGRIPPDGELRYEPLLRDALPPWEDTIFGTVPGGIGETCTLALIVAGLFLIYRGYLRWELPTMVIAAAAVAAALLPVESAVEGGGYDWFPIFAAEEGRAVGVAYVLYHLTSGELMLGAFLLAGDTIATPMRAGGQAIFAAGVGALTIFMRLYGVMECDCYWSILIMNTLVGPIDRRVRRPVLGMGE